MKITTLIENRSGEKSSNLKAEWGLSLHIFFNGHNILFDSGASGVFADNAEKLSIDLASVETAILSHHHFDHGGGLRRFFEANSGAKVHLGKAYGIECFGSLLFFKKYIGIDQALYKDYPDRFVAVSEPVEILSNVFIFPHITGPYPKPAGNKRLLVKQNGKLVQDDFSHEIVMAIKENNQLVIFTGCSHNGILNLVETVAREFKGVSVKGVVGGFHLVSGPPLNFMSASKSQVEELARQVLHYPIDQTYTGHCTGEKAYSILKGLMGERINRIMVGSSFEL